MIDIAVSFRVRTGSVGAPFLAGAVQHALGSAGIRRASISIVLMGDEDIHTVNRTFLKHDYPTDVITFPLERDPLEAEILIGVEAARRQAAEFRVPVREELVRLAVHGALHVAGYDDRSEADRARMLRKQEQCVSAYLGKQRKKS